MGLKSLQDEFEDEEMRSCAIMLKDMLSRDDLAALNERFKHYRQEQDLFQVNYEPWYVWFINQVDVKIKST